MADNVTVDNAALAAYDVRTDEDGTGKHYQLIKLAYGPADTFTWVEAGVGLPVGVVGSVVVADGGGSISVDDGGGILTVDGTVTLGAGTANIGDVDVLSVPAPLSTQGGGTEALALRVTIANDSTGVLSIDDNGGSLTVDGTVAISGSVVVTATDLDIRNLDVAQDDVRVGGMAALDAAVADNPVAVGGRASSAVPTAVSADGDAVWLWLDRSGGVIVNGRDAHDAALNANTNPLLVGGRAQATAPTDVSADGDAVRAWFLRNGALATVLTAAGALIGGDATNGLDVDVTRVSGTVTVSATDLDIRNLDVAQDDVRVGGMAALDAAVADNPVAVGGRASTAVPTAVSADGDAVWAWYDRRGAAKVVLVDDAGDSVMDGTNDAVRVNVVAGSGGATQYAEDTASAGGESVIMVGVVRKDSAGTLVDADLDRSELQVDASGALRVTGGGGGTEYTEDIASPADPVGGAVMLRRRDSPASEVTTAGDWIAQNATPYGAGFVQILTSAGAFVDSFGGGTQYTEDAAAPADPVGTALAMVRDDALSGQTSTDGDVIVARGTDKGELYVKHVDAIPVTDNGGSLTVDGTVAISGSVTVDSELPAAAALTDNFANPTAPAVGAFLMGWDGANWDRVLAPGGSLSIAIDDFNLALGQFAIGDGTNGIEILTSGGDNQANTLNELITAAFGYMFDGSTWDRMLSGGGVESGALRVTIASDSTGVLSVDDNGGSLTVDQGAAGTAWEIVGDVAHDAAAPANPVVIGAQMETQADSAPGTRAGTDGDAVKLATMDGALFVAGSAPQASHTHFDSTSAVQTDATIKAAPGAGLSIYVTDIVFSIGAATASSIFFEEGSTKVLGPYYLEAVAGRGLAISFKTPKKITANTALTVTNTGSVTYAIDVGWFVGPG